MNLNGLAKLYGKLTPRERLPAIVGAAARGDTAEVERLTRSAPRNSFEVPDYYGLAEGMLLVALVHQAGQLDLAARYEQARGLLAWNRIYFSESGRTAPEVAAGEAQAERIFARMRLLAYQLTVDSAAWERLCAELTINPERLLRDLPGYATHQELEDEARAVAFTPEQTATYLRQQFGDTAQVPTVESAWEALRAFVDRMQRLWS
jgi:hypothetical protein